MPNDPTTHPPAGGPQPITDRSIRNIPVPHHDRRPLSVTTSATPDRETEPEQPRVIARGYNDPEPPRKKTRGGHSKAFIATAVLAFFVLGASISSAFSKATVTIVPERLTIAAPSPLGASQDAAEGRATAEGLAYQMLTVEHTATTTVESSGSHQVSRSASGKVTIVNAYSTASQTLIKNTRFETPGGKIYRIRETVVVPGGKKAADGSLTPGSVTATLYADQSGEGSNAPAGTTFVIPGFKGDPKYAAFSAKAIEPLVGGFVGQEPTITDADKASASKTLAADLEQSLNATAGGALPSGFIMVPGTLSVTLSPVTVDSDTNSSSAEISQTATGKAAIIKLSDLAGALVAQQYSSYGGEPVVFAAPQAVILINTSDDSASSTNTFTEGDDVSLGVQGPVDVLWVFDSLAVQSALAGKPKGQFETVMHSFSPSIKTATVGIRPLWSRTFPRDPADISIQEGQ